MAPHRWAGILAILSIIGASLPVVQAQTQAPEKIIQSRIDCSRCEIRVVPLIVLGDTSGPGELSQPARQVVLDDRGRYYVSFATQTGPLVFDSRGRFQGTIGRAGDGPGEFRTMLIAEVARDTAWIIDGINARLSAMRYDGSAWRYAASWQRPGMPVVPFAVSRLLSGTLMMNGSIATAERIGFPLHLMDTSGAIRSFGTLNPVLRPGATALGMRKLWPSSQGGVWVAHASRFQFEHYDVTGRMTGHWSRPVDWFLPHDGSQLLGPEEKPPSPRLSAIAEDAQGLIWILVAVPDPRYREAFATHMGPGRIDIVNRDLLSDTIIEIYDLRAGALLATKRIPQALLAVIGQDGNGLQAVGEKRTEMGGWQMPLFHLEIAGRTP